MEGLSAIDPTSEPIRTLVLILDLCGTFAFALSGAMAGVRARLDVYGVLVLSFVASSFGGITRDLLIGSVPPPRSTTGVIWLCRWSPECWCLPGQHWCADCAARSICSTR